MPPLPIHGSSISLGATVVPAHTQDEVSHTTDTDLRPPPRVFLSDSPLSSRTSLRPETRGEDMEMGLLDSSGRALAPPVRRDTRRVSTKTLATRLGEGLQVAKNVATTIGENFEAVRNSVSNGVKTATTSKEGYSVLAGLAGAVTMASAKLAADAEPGSDNKKGFIALSVAGAVATVAMSRNTLAKPSLIAAKYGEYRRNNAAPRQQDVERDAGARAPDDGDAETLQGD